MNEVQSRCSLLGIPPSVAVELSKQNIDPVPYLSVRGKEEFLALIQNQTVEHIIEEPTLGDRIGCIEAVLGLPGLKQVREILPCRFKNAIKGIVKSMIGDVAEP